MSIGSLSGRISILVMVLWTGQSHASAQLFEFSDDFTKDIRSQRDPYEERIETERHDFTQSAVTVGRGVLQVEGGYSYFYKDTGEEIEGAHTTPETMFRVGLSEDIELRLRTDYAWQFIDEAPNKSGAEDLRITLKLQMTRQCEFRDNWTPTSALEIRASAPTGGDAWSTNQAGISLDYIYEWQIAEGVTFAGSTGWGTDGLGDFGLVADDPTSERFNVLTQSAVVGFEVSEQNTMYAEWFGLFSDGLTDEYVMSIFNVGIDHYVTENLVLDVRLGTGLTDDSDDFFCGVGGAYRF